MLPSQALNDHWNPCVVGNPCVVAPGAVARSTRGGRSLAPVATQRPWQAPTALARAVGMPASPTRVPLLGCSDPDVQRDPTCQRQCRANPGRNSRDVCSRWSMPSPSVGNRPNRPTLISSRQYVAATRRGTGLRLARRPDTGATTCWRKKSRARTLVLAHDPRQPSRHASCCGPSIGAGPNPSRKCMNARVHEHGIDHDNRVGTARCVAHTPHSVCLNGFHALLNAAQMNRSRWPVHNAAFWHAYCMPQPS